ncbi:unnamed protein product, partial [Effrenium voratum]
HFRGPSPERKNESSILDLRPCPRAPPNRATASFAQPRSPRKEICPSLMDHAALTEHEEYVLRRLGNRQAPWQNLSVIADIGLRHESETRLFYGGPKSYSYPLHRDLPDGDVLCVLHSGCKDVVMLKPESRKHLARLKVPGQFTWAYDFFTDSNVSGVKGWAGTLRKGELLYMPGEMLHHIRNSCRQSLAICRRPWRASVARDVALETLKSLRLAHEDEHSVEEAVAALKARRKGFYTEELPLPGVSNWAKQLARRIVSDEVQELDSDGAFFRPPEQIHEGLLGSEGSQRCALLESFMDLRELAEVDREIVRDPLRTGSKRRPQVQRSQSKRDQLAFQSLSWLLWAQTPLRRAERAAGSAFRGARKARAGAAHCGAGGARGAAGDLGAHSPRLPDFLPQPVHGARGRAHGHQVQGEAEQPQRHDEVDPHLPEAPGLGVDLPPGAAAPGGGCGHAPAPAQAGSHGAAARGLPHAPLHLPREVLLARQLPAGAEPSAECAAGCAAARRDGPRASEAQGTSKSEEDFENQTSRAIQRIANQNIHKGQQTAVRGCASREPTAAHDPDAFCSAIMAGIDGAQIVPHLRWDHEQYYASDPLKDPMGQWKTHCNHGCFIEGLELFDNKMFKISPMEAQGMDPNQRQALEVFYETTMSAGIDDKKLMRSNIGVFMGGTGGVVSEFGQVPKDDVGGALGSTSGSAAIMANRISFCMGIHGPNFFIDLEGAASLTAFNLAVDSVQRDKAQCIAAVALGVDCNVHPQGLLPLGWAGLLSKKGRCLSFDSYADGYIRGEGYTGLYVSPLMKEENGKKMIDEDPPIIALASGTFINNNGRSASLTAPSGAMYQELVANCVRSADLSPLDVDAVECHATGNVLADAVEATALTRAYRALAMDQDTEEEMLGLLAGKTNVGNMRPAMGCAALLRVIVGQAMGCMPPSLHLHKLNPHVVQADDVPSFFVTEHVQHRMTAAFVACTASGIGGSNAHTILWGRACTRQMKMEKPVKAEEVLAFWPGGGGDLDPACEPRRGCSIVGSWSLMDTPQTMKGEGLDQFSYTVTLGEHGCEWFQIWLDGERERILHPAEARAQSTAKVQGPHAYGQVAPFGWVIDTRPGSGDADRPRVDVGQPGDQFQVQLQIKGRFRAVTWERLDTQNVQRNGLPKTMGRYFIVGSWNDWQPEEMTLEDEGVGRFSIKATMPKGNQRFQILRNRDWRQLIYPETCYADCDSVVKGPDANGHDRYWNIEVSASRNVMLIDLDLWDEDQAYSRGGSKSSRSSVSNMKVSWRGIGKQDLTEQELFERSRPSFFLVGSWDGFMRRSKMRFDALRQRYVGRLPVPLRGGAAEYFQILSSGDWNSVVHPSTHEAGLENTAAVRGGGVRGYPCWRLEAEAPQQSDARRRPAERYEVQLSTKGSWQVNWQKCTEDESSDEELDPELYGPPGLLGL